MTRFLLLSLLLMGLCSCGRIGDPACGNVLEVDSAGAALISTDETGALKVCRPTTVHHYNAVAGEHQCYDLCTVFITKTPSGKLY